MAIQDFWQSFKKGLSSPADSFYAITPSNSADLPIQPRAIYIGSAGDLVVIDANGNETTFVNAVAGSWLPIRPKRVKATSTASNIVGIY
jgi:hypothetical protein